MRRIPVGSFCNGLNVVIHKKDVTRMEECGTGWCDSVTVSVTDNITIVTQQHEDPAPAPARLYQQGIDPDLDVPSSMNFCVEWSREPLAGTGRGRGAHCWRAEHLNLAASQAQD